MWWVEKLVEMFFRLVLPVFFLVLGFVLLWYDLVVFDGLSDPLGSWKLTLPCLILIATAVFLLVWHNSKRGRAKWDSQPAHDPDNPTDEQEEHHRS